MGLLLRFLPLRLAIVAASLLCATLSVSAQSGPTGPIGTDASTLTVAVSATTGVQDTTSITITATAAALSGSVLPTGYVLFFSNGNPIFAQQLANGVATRQISTLPAGTNVITATYIGDANFAAENSTNNATITISGLTAAFALGAASPTTATVVQGKTAIFSLPITANSTFGGTVTFACSGAPTGSSCSISPTTVTFTPIAGNEAAPQTATVSIVFATTAANASAIQENHSSLMVRSLGGLSVASLFLMLLPRQRGKRWNALTMLAVIGLGLCSITTLSGCGGSNKSSSSSTTSTVGTGTFPITVTATSGSTSQTASFSVTVSE